MISPALFMTARCPECVAALTPQPPGAVCPSCHRVFDGAHGYLDLRPLAAFAEQTKYLDAALHVDARRFATTGFARSWRSRQAIVWSISDAAAAAR
jgi:hypothetical protein